MKKLELSTEIFTWKHIQAAREAYNGYASIMVLPGKQKWILVFTHCKNDESQTVREFENYLIGLENSL